MQYTEVESAVKEILCRHLGVEPSHITPEHTITDDLGADSLDNVELIMQFEKQFSIAISDEDAEKIKTVGDAVSYIVKRTDISR